ncbi:MAG: terminase family protein [Bryobacteraceae bacterium]
MKFLHRADPVAFAQQVLHFQPDPHQAKVLDPSIRRGLLNCSRQWGKSTITSIRAVHHAFFKENSLTLVLAPTERQSAELVRKCRQWLAMLDIKPRTDGSNKTSLLLPNGARIVGLPGREDNIRGFSSVSLLLIDEAARVPDELYHSVRPMIAAAGETASIWLLSTPKGKRGFFYDEFANPASTFAAVTVPASQCPRIAPEFLEQERISLPEHIFAQEYMCQFSQSAAGLFNDNDIEASLRDELPPMFPHNDPFPPLQIVPPCNTLFPYPYQAFFVGVDVGQRQDFTAIAILELLTVFTEEVDRVTFERKTRSHFRLRHVDRVPLNTEFEAIVDYLVRLVSRQDLAERTNVVIDATGVGAPIYEMFRKRYPPVRESLRLVITGGNEAYKEHGKPHWTVPRRDLLYGVENLLRNRQLDIATSTPHSKTLIRELSLIERNFTDAGREVLASSCSAAHDDLVFALALAVWRARRHTAPTAVPPDAFRYLTNPQIPGLAPP